MAHKRNAGFSGIDLLAIMTVIVLLILVFPFISELLSPGHKSHALKNKGRSIWVAIVSANSEREFLEQPSLWPADLIAFLEKEGTPFVTENSTAEDYFNYLMSNNGADIDPDAENRIAGDLKPSMLTGPGIVALPDGEKRFGSKNNAWHVVIIGDEDYAEMPFLITRNVNLGALDYAPSGFVYASANDTPVVTMNKKISPFQDKRAMWITKGGNSVDARPIIMRSGRICPVPKPSDDAKLKFLRSSGGSQE